MTTEKYKHFEPFIEERAKAAKAKASRIFRGDYADLEEALLVLRSIISDYYNIPFFDEYFEDRSVDDLIFEVELINLKRLPQTKVASNVVNENKKEAETLFDDMASEDGFMDVPEPKIGNDVFDKIAKDFMKTGDFK